MAKTRHHILGTAGHIDHGKSALILALTGVDPDRLPEEKRRGVTIELGFAQLALPSGNTLGIVDVPGHEKFIRNMVAGASGIDIALLAIAADDGVMVQTREHIRILSLMGVARMVVALTKCDLVDADWCELVEVDIRELLREHGYADAPIVRTSVVTSLGMDQLVQTLDEMADAGTGADEQNNLRLPIDRVFTVEGSGTIVTGTLWSGTARLGDTVEILPAGISARIRGIQIHGSDVESAASGQRVAFNLAGIARSDAPRGSMAITPGSASVSDCLDVEIRYEGMPDSTAPLKSGARVHVHHGTTTSIGRVLLFESAHLEPGSTAYAQLRLEHAIVARYGDRFIVRSYSPTYTIGGGEVLTVAAAKRSRLRAGEKEILEALAAHDTKRAVTAIMIGSGLPHTSIELASQLHVARGEVAAILNQSDLERIVGDKETAFISRETARDFEQTIEATLRDFHDKNQNETAMSAAALRQAATPHLSLTGFEHFTKNLAEQNVVTITGGKISHNSAASVANRQLEDICARALERISQQGMTPDTIAELAAFLGVDKKLVIAALAEPLAQGELVRLAGDLYFALPAIASARETVTRHLRTCLEGANAGGLTEGKGGATAAQIRDALGISRKFAIPILEYFDSIAVTKRLGNLRVLNIP